MAAFEPKLTETMKARIFDEALKGAIIEMKEDKALMLRACMERAQLYGRDDAYSRYVALYDQVLRTGSGS